MRGDRPLPSHQRVLVFSPHPDDQRVEARNLKAAAHADRLGLAEYYAMGADRILKP